MNSPKRKQQIKIIMERKAKHHLAETLIEATETAMIWNHAQKTHDIKMSNKAEDKANRLDTSINEQTGYMLSGTHQHPTSPKQMLDGIKDIKKLEMQPNKLTGIDKFQRRMRSKSNQRSSN
jgi:hypothetical protein